MCTNIKKNVVNQFDHIYELYIPRYIFNFFCEFPLEYEPSYNSGEAPIIKWLRKYFWIWKKLKTLKSLGYNCYNVTLIVCIIKTDTLVTMLACISWIYRIQREVSVLMLNESISDYCVVDVTLFCLPIIPGSLWLLKLDKQALTLCLQYCVTYKLLFKPLLLNWSGLMGVKCTTTKYKLLFLTKPIQSG